MTSRAPAGAPAEGDGAPNADGPPPLVVRLRGMPDRGLVEGLRARLPRDGAAAAVLFVVTQIALRPPSTQEREAMKALAALLTAAAASVHVVVDAPGATGFLARQMLRRLASRGGARGPAFVLHDSLEAALALLDRGGSGAHVALESPPGSPG